MLRLRIWLTSLGLILAISAGSAVASLDKITPEVQNRFSAEPGQMQSVIVHLTDQVDIRSLDEMLYYRKVTRLERHRIVMNELHAAVERSQLPVQTYLDELVANGAVEGYTPYWIVNCFVVYGTEAAITALSDRGDVDHIEMNVIPELIEPIRGPENPLDDNASTPPPGVVAVRAPLVWYQLGVTGAGALVGTLDTGVDGTHPNLAARWRGTVAPAAQCWRSPVSGSVNPTDTDQHGTHVMGTICGACAAGTLDTTGVAPGAMWIGDDAIGQGVGPALDSDILDGFQWMADPDGNPNTIIDVPDVVQNSWGVYSGFSGYSDCDSRWDAAILALEAGGTVVTFSAGNEGPGAQTHRSPANAVYDSVSFFSVGAVDCTPPNVFPYPIASFSSRGPSDCNTSIIKPEVSAPGVNVYSSIPGGGYTSSFSGTSMAGPHVAGIVALMRSANPDLDVRDAKSILMRTARDEGAVGEDNTFGFGFVDAYEAVLAAMANNGRIRGTIVDANTLSPLQATVAIVGGPQQTTAGVNGVYQLLVPGDSTYTVHYSLYGYFPQDFVLAVVVDDTTIQDVNLVPRPIITLLNEDFEDGAPDWTHNSAGGQWIDQWHVSTERSHSPGQSYKCGDTGAGNYGNLLDARLISPSVAIPPEAKLYFWSDITSELSVAFPDSCYDGGVLEISANAGPFVEVTPTPGYPKTFRYRSGGGNPATGPMLGQPCLAGTIPWQAYQLDLAAYAGQNIQLRFRFGSDQGTGQEGWYVDDVLISALGNEVIQLFTPEELVIFVDGNDLVLTWADDGNPHYRVYSDLLSGGAFTTLEGETSVNSLVIPNGWNQDELKFYRVVGWDGQ